MAASTSTTLLDAASPAVATTTQKPNLLPAYRTIDELLKSHAAEPVDMPLVGYPATGLTDFEEHTAKDLDKYADAAVARFIGLGLEPADPTQEKAPIVAILAPSSFETVVSIFALNRLGWGLLFLSTRLTAPAYTRLLEMADCNTIISTKAYDATISEIQTERTIKLLPMLTRSDYRGVEAPKFHRECDLTEESRKIAWIVHSSGSTGFPKPIFLTNYACLANFCKTMARRAFCTSPLFHSHGLMELFRCIYSRNTFFMGNYAFPVTRQNLIEAMRVAEPKLMCAVPYVLKLLAESEDGIDVLARAELVLYAGSSCPDDLGDQLVERGVNLVANYGATETGQIMTSFRPPGDKEWSYMRLHRPVADHVLMDEIAPGIFECVALDGLPSKGPSNSDDPPNSFRTRDLFAPHPDPKKHNYWKYVSRLDDRITLTNGEKVLPIPMEGRIRQHDLVQEAAMFGVSKVVPGLLVFRSEGAAVLSDEEYLDAIWPTIESTNALAETFARIPKELVVVLPADTTYPKTDKGTFIRAQLYDQFSSIIEAAYDGFENGEIGTLQLDIPDLEAWLISKFKEEFGVNPESIEQDIFSAGVDSLQTMRMWGIIKKELDLGEGRGELSQNVVFEKGNVKALAKYLYFLRTSEGEEENDEVNLMRGLIEKYSSFETVPGDLPAAEKDSVLVTGATGNLGGFLLADLLKRESVSKVWALVRATDQNAALSRVLRSLSSRGIKLFENERSKLIVLPSDFSRADLGLNADNLQTLLSTLTHVIHSAWAVNFNLGVQSFETQHIQGTYNLLNLCLRSRLPTPAKFFFCSSISAAGGTPKPARIREIAIEDLNHAQRMGYGRSKLVTEHIVRNAMRETGMLARVLRIGQLAGDGLTGVWNETEAVALMIRSAISIGTLPALDETISWLPVDHCSKTIMQLVFATSEQTGEGSDPDLVYHVLNPHRFHWTNDLLPALRRTRLPFFEAVNQVEWLDQLKRSDADLVKNPSRKLYDFWNGKYRAVQATGGAKDVTDEDTQGLLFETDRTVVDAPLLGQVPDLIGEGYIERFVESWLRKWGV